MSDSRREMQHTDWRLFKNTTNEEIPANAWVEIHGSERDGNKSAVLHGRKRTSGGKAGGFNGPTKVAPDGYGRLTTGVGYVYFDNADTPVAGEDWGPVADEWKIKKSGSGVLILGPTKGERVRAKIGSDGSAGAGGASAAIGITTEIIPARSGSGCSATPGSGSVEICDGSGGGDWENWSGQSIDSGVYVVGITIGGSTVIVAAFC